MYLVNFCIYFACVCVCAHASTDRSNLTAMVVTSPSRTGRSGWTSLLACSCSWVCWQNSCRPNASLQHRDTQCDIGTSSSPLGFCSHPAARYLISARVCAACTCLPSGDSTLSRSIWHRQYLALRAWFSYRMACRTAERARVRRMSQKKQKK